MTMSSSYDFYFVKTASESPHLVSLMVSISESSDDVRLYMTFYLSNRNNGFHNTLSVARSFDTCYTDSFSDGRYFLYLDSMS